MLRFLFLFVVAASQYRLHTLGTTLETGTLWTLSDTQIHLTGIFLMKTENLTGMYFEYPILFRYVENSPLIFHITKAISNNEVITEFF